MREGTRRIARAYAKINLGLAVQGLDRQAGYHRLRSVLALLELHDEVAVEWGAPGPLAIAVDADLGGGENLVGKAWRWYQKRYGEGGAVPRRVDLRKRIPVAAGLGGGSADAGVFLRMLWDLPPGQPAPAPLVTASAAVGMDVPFFVSGWPVAAVAGFGERVRPLRPLPPYWVVLAHPGFALSTAQVFAAWDGLGARRRDRPRNRVGLWHGRLPSRPLANDLEPAAVMVNPALADFRRQLEARAPGVAVHLSGSGPTFFALLPVGAAGGQAAARLAEAWQAVAARVAVTRILADGTGAGINGTAS